LDAHDYQNLVKDPNLDLANITKHVEKHLSKNIFRYDNPRRLEVDHWSLQKIIIKPINPQRLRSLPFERITKKKGICFLTYHYFDIDKKVTSLGKFMVFILPNKKVLPVVKKPLLSSEINKRSYE